MGFSRSFLKSAGLTDDQISAVMEEHNSVVAALSKQRDDFKADAEKYKADADKLPDVQKELDTLKGGEDYKAKYEKEHTDFEAYKTQVAKDAEDAKIRAAYRKLLSEEKISEKRLDSIIKVTDFSGMKLDKDGNLENDKALRESIGKDWADFKVTQRERGPQVNTPPAPDNNGGSALGEIRQMTAKWHAAKYGSVPTQEKG